MGRALVAVGVGVVLGILMAACGPKAGTPADDGLCVGGETLTQPGPEQRPSGYESCEDGVVHRVDSVACDPGGWTEGNCTTPDEQGCDTDMQCGGGQLCLQTSEPSGGCRCSAGCSSDADCDDGQTCYCNGAFSTCIDSPCETDADCDDGERCRLQEKTNACGEVGRSLRCTTPADTCAHSEDCEGCEECLFVGGETQAWTCITSDACAPCG